MKKSNFCWSVFMALIAVMVVSCGGGVDQSDPVEVAEAALIYKTTDNFESMKEIINPSNTYQLEQIDKIIEAYHLAEQKGYEKSSKEPKTFIFKSMSDINDGATHAKVFFTDSEGYTREVALEKENGKWYVERVN